VFDINARVIATVGSDGNISKEFILMDWKKGKIKWQLFGRLFKDLGRFCVTNP